ncbi:MAG TPA: HEAT repeat domain-containing protein [Planctomycetota bacterium]|nr:HEAT repeat domain-containing protein [Planctomycetota bacterium]
MLKRLVLVSLLAAFVMPLLAQDESFGDKVRQLLGEGTDLYKKGKWAEASSKFEEAFQLKPSSDQVYAFIKRAGEDMIGRMMNDPDRKIQDVARRLMELAKPGEPLREGKAVVLKYIEDLKAEDHAVWRNAFWHLKNFGPWAVRFLMPAMADQQQDRYRSRVMLLFTEMGIDCSLAVVEALDSKNPFVRQNAAIVLGNIKDERAIPALKRVSEDANEPAEVKKFANEALLKIIRGKDPAQWKKATDYYYELATKYYYSHSSVIHSFQRHYLIWKWDVEKDILTERKVARMSYNEQLAEEALFDLLALDPNYTDKATSLSAWSLLACVHFAEALESKAAVEAALQALRYDEIDKPGLSRLIRDIEGLSDASVKDLSGKIDAAATVADVEKLLNEYFAKQAKIIRANVMGELPGKRYIYEALARSLADGNYLVAKSCLDTIREMGRPEDLPSPPLPPEAQGKEEAQPAAGTGSASSVSGTMGYPLIEALTNEDKRVRYAAANAMVAINPQRRKLGMELVVPNLIDALGEQGVRVALVIYEVQDDNDRNFVNGFRKLLTSINVFPVMVTSGSEGIIKAKQFPTQDVVIIQKKICGQVYFKESDTKKEIVETVFDTLRDDVRTKSIARIVLGDNAGEVEAANKEFLEKGTAQGVVGKDVHKLDLQAMFDKIFDSDKAKKDAKDRANDIAKDAAETLASIDPTNTLYPYRDAVEALIKTVSPEILREDFIRIPAARALGRFGDQRAVDVLAKVVSDKDADAERAARQKGVRWQCSKALSQIFKSTGITPASEVFEVLKKNTKDGDYDIEFTCAEALGNATLTNPQRLDLSKFRRIERETYTSDDP